MYFDIRPKTKKEDLFSMDYQLELLKKYLLDESVRMIVIKGLRRTGKTSLLNVALNEANIKSIKIDVRETPFYDKKEFLLFIVKKLEIEFRDILNKIIKGISGVRLGFDKFSFELFFSKEENLNSFFEKLDAQLRKKNQNLVLAFDEAQLLKNINFDYVLASIFDNYRSIKILLTGSEIGIIDKFLGKADYNAPLFGRAYLEIEVTKIKEEEASRFLENGFKQINKRIGFEEIKEVIDNLDGIIGWITYYGWFRYEGFSHLKAIEKVKEDGRIIVKKELENFLKERKAKTKYLKLIRYLIRGHNRWNSLQQEFRKGGVIVSDSQLGLYLKELSDYGFIEKIIDKYFVSDPLLDLVL